LSYQSFRVRAHERAGSDVEMTDTEDIKGLLDHDFEAIETELQNGHGGDPETQGRALALLLRHVRILVRRSTVTEDECRKRRADCPGVKLFTNPKETVLTELARQGGWIAICAYLVYLVVTK